MRKRHATHPDPAPCSLIWKIERSQIMQNQIVKQRPLGVTILAILAAIAAVIAAIHALQFLGLIPFFIGPYGYAVRHVNFWYALMYGLLVWVYIWLFQMLWRVDREAWIFLVIITLFYLILDT